MLPHGGQMVHSTSQHSWWSDGAFHQSTQYHMVVSSCTTQYHMVVRWCIPPVPQYHMVVRWCIPPVNTVPHDGQMLHSTSTTVPHGGQMVHSTSTTVSHGGQIVHSASQHSWWQTVHSISQHNTTWWSDSTFHQSTQYHMVVSWCIPPVTQYHMVFGWCIPPVSQHSNTQQSDRLLARKKEGSRDQRRINSLITLCPQLAGSFTFFFKNTKENDKDRDAVIPITQRKSQRKTIARMSLLTSGPWWRYVRLHGFFYRPAPASLLSYRPSSPCACTWNTPQPAVRRRGSCQKGTGEKNWIA